MRVCSISLMIKEVSYLINLCKNQFGYILLIHLFFYHVLDTTFLNEHFNADILSNAIEVSSSRCRKQHLSFRKKNFSISIQKKFTSYLKVNIPNSEKDLMVLLQVVLATHIDLEIINSRSREKLFSNSFYTY